MDINNAALYVTGPTRWRTGGNSWSSHEMDDWLSWTETTECVGPVVPAAGGTGAAREAAAREARAATSMVPGLDAGAGGDETSRTPPPTGGADLGAVESVVQRLTTV